MPNNQRVMFLSFLFPYYFLSALVAHSHPWDPSFLIKLPAMCPDPVSQGCHFCWGIGTGGNVAPHSTRKPWFCHSRPLSMLNLWSSFTCVLVTNLPESVRQHIHPQQGKISVFISYIWASRDNRSLGFMVSQYHKIQKTAWDGFHLNSKCHTCTIAEGPWKADHPGLIPQGQCDTLG